MQKSQFSPLSVMEVDREKIDTVEMFSFSIDIKVSTGYNVYVVHANDFLGHRKLCIFFTVVH
jgi:hypothetical protein